MTCKCGKRFVEAYHQDWPELCDTCAKIEVSEHNRTWWQWFSTLSPQQKTDYMNNGPYTLQQVKEMMFNTKDEAI